MKALRIIGVSLLVVALCAAAGLVWLYLTLCGGHPHGLC